MKRLYVFWLLLFPLFCFAQERYTANWYKSDPAKYLNQIVTVYIQSCEPSSFEAVKGYVSYHCFTSYQGKPGGYIYMLVPSNKSRSFFRDYSDVRSKANPSEKSQRSAKAKFSESAICLMFSRRKHSIFIQLCLFRSHQNFPAFGALYILPLRRLQALQNPGPL